MTKPGRLAIWTAVLLILFGLVVALGAAFAQPKAPAFGKPGEPIHLVVGFQPYYVLTWTAAIARDKDYWRKYLPGGRNAMNRIFRKVRRAFRVETADIRRWIEHCKRLSVRKEQ